MTGEVQLGCGLIAIGRQWGTTPEVPSEAQALNFLDAAYEAGIRNFDTAPAYGLSEARLGKFLRGLTTPELRSVTVSTKFGEHWNPDTQTTYVDHSLEALLPSIDRSMELLGKVSILQLHKTSEAVLNMSSVPDAIYYALTRGVHHVGASVSDVSTAELVIHNKEFDYLQVPYNKASPEFKEPIERAFKHGFRVMTNRPFQMGAVTAEAVIDKHQAAVEAFKFILEADFIGTVLTGTANAEHLRDNIDAFRTAEAQINA